MFIFPIKMVNLLIMKLHPKSIIIQEHIRRSLKCRCVDHAALFHILHYIKHITTWFILTTCSSNTNF